MTKWIGIAAAVFCIASLGLYMLVSRASAQEEGSGEEPANCLNYKMTTLDGKEVDLKSMEGKVLLVVNVASRCGLTPQYEGLEQLHKKYAEKGFEVVGFPCNQFLGQEPGTAEQIKKFCSTKYGVTFPMFSKVEVNGEKACPLYQQLVKTELSPAGAGPISWNFEKFVVGRNGVPVARFSPKVVPDNAELVKVLERELAVAATAPATR